MHQEEQTLDVKELLRLVKEKCSTDAAICTATGLNKTTLMRIRNGDTKQPHAKTRAKLKTLANLMKALNA
jgi:hypothetical protein